MEDNFKKNISVIRREQSDLIDFDIIFHDNKYFPDEEIKKVKDDYKNQFKIINEKEEIIGLIWYRDYSIPFGNSSIKINYNNKFVSIILSKAFREKGLGKKALKLFINLWFSVNTSENNIMARISLHNIISLKLFKSLGFQKTDTIKQLGDLVVYELRRSNVIF